MASVPPCMDWVDGGAGRLRVEKTGTGPCTPVILVHGGGGKAFREWARAHPQKFLELAKPLTDAAKRSAP